MNAVSQPSCVCPDVALYVVVWIFGIASYNYKGDMQGLHRTQSVYQSLQALECMFEKASKNFSYRLLQLEMTIDEPNISIERTKKQDISELIQLYMIGVEVLESSGDPRFSFFRTKLHDLMLKKSVIKQLKFVAPEEIMLKQKQVRQQKKKEYQSIIVKSEQQGTAQAESILSNATITVENYKGIVEDTLKKQQRQIRERLNSRKKRPDSANSLTKPVNGSPKLKKQDSKPSSEYYSPPPLPKPRIKTNTFQFKVEEAGTPNQTTEDSGQMLSTPDLKSVQGETEADTEEILRTNRPQDGI